MADRAYLERLSRELTDQGRLVEAGWISLRLATIPMDTPAARLEELRNVFFAGAQHLFGSIMTILDPGDVEPTDKDLERMDQIDTELKAFIADFSVKNLPTEGSA